MNLFLVILYFHGVISVFYEENNGFLFKDVVAEQIAESQLQCIHLCHRIDSEAGVLFEKPSCKCVRIGTNEGKNDVIGGKISSGIYIQKKITKNVITEESRVVGKTVEKELTNIGLNKPASLSSTYSTSYARYGNDGDKDTKATTNGNGFGWWRIDLEKESTIDHFSLLLGDTAFYRNKFENLEIKISLDTTLWKLCKTIGVPSKIKFNVTCDGGRVTARYVRLEDTKKISFKEVSVIGYEN